MQNHPNSIGVQQNGCGAIANLAGGRAANKNGLNAFNPVPDAIAKAGGIEQALQVMCRQLRNPLGIEPLTLVGT